MPDHPLVTRGKKRSRSIEPSAAAAIRYWPICPEGHGMTYVHSGKRGQWVCRVCQTAKATAKKPEPVQVMKRLPVCAFCHDPVAALRAVNHPWTPAPVMACDSCATVVEQLFG